jgi:hypothetical protein
MPVQDKQAPEARQDANERRRPFDMADLERLPSPRGDDPPYRSWWVVTEQTGAER